MAILRENISPSISPSTQLDVDKQSLDRDLNILDYPSTQLSNYRLVLGENSLPLISPSTSVQSAQQVSVQSLLSTIPPNTQLSSNSEVLGEKLSLLISPSTSVQGDSQIPESSLLLSISSAPQVSNDNQVLGENSLPLISPSTYRKHGEGSGNLSWGYANANSTKKKPIKQLYFEWEYRSMRGKTYVRSRSKRTVKSLSFF